MLRNYSNMTQNFQVETIMSEINVLASVSGENCSKSTKIYVKFLALRLSREFFGFNGCTDFTQ